MEENQNNDEPEVVEFSYVDTTATKKVFDLRKRIRAVKGGTSASKTISIIIWHIDYCQTPRRKPEISTIGSQSFPHLDLGVIRDFKNIMKDRGYWKKERWNETKHFYTFETGNILEFGSFDTYGKAHGPRRKNLYLNEANTLPWNIVDQLIMRTNGIVWLDWNPVEEFWFHTELLAHRADEIDYLTLTYKDNEALDEITVKEIESHKHNTNWWKVYGLGQDGETESRIYTGWIIVDEIPAEARLRRKGLDFGFSHDEAALVDVYEYEHGYLLDEQVYEKGLHNDDLAKKIGKKTVLTVADSSEPKSISEIAQYGVHIIGSKKGKGSITHGIDTVQSKKIYVTKRSLNIIKEYKSYHYKTDQKTGKILNEPEDILNHAMDAIRYAIADLNPKRDPDDDVKELPKGRYETPGLGSGQIQNASSEPVPTLSLVNVTDRKERMNRLLEVHKEKKQDSYETDKPWQRPGLG